MDVGRRLLLRGGAALAVLAALPRAVLAAVWPEKAFAATEADAAMSALFGATEAAPSDQITLKVPEIAENGAVVPVTISTTLENVESISIVVENNPRPLAASFEIPAGTLPNVSSRIKMGETSDVVAVVKTQGGIYSATKQVKVTIGGCGG
ncbi:MAG: thiosulfate oxidation carrier protein SoxY [Gammaproteobacteria bacterium]|jgi:sulfur-oxidizing protein SoxY|nr:thiosulfate oxidation carrier protein SoxY [Gammaproteobacteria bacterium]